MTITPVTPAQMEKLKAELATKSEVTDTTISGHGVVANYHYDGESQVLSVDVIKHPLYLPVSVIEGKIRDAVNAA